MVALNFEYNYICTLIRSWSFHSPDGTWVGAMNTPPMGEKVQYYGGFFVLPQLILTLV